MLTNLRVCVARSTFSSSIFHLENDLIQKTPRIFVISESVLKICPPPGPPGNSFTPGKLSGVLSCRSCQPPELSGVPVLSCRSCPVFFPFLCLWSPWEVPEGRWEVVRGPCPTEIVRVHFQPKLPDDNFLGGIPPGSWS